MMLKLILKRIFSNIISNNTFETILTRRIKNGKTIKVNVNSIFFNEKGLCSTGENRGILNEVENLVNDFASKDKTVLALKPYVRSARKNPIIKEEQKLYNDVLEEFREIKPATRKVYPYTELEIITEEQINGNKLETIYEIKDKYLEKEELYEISLSSKNKKLILRGNSLFGDESLQKEFNKFLNGREPNKQLFEDFVKQKNIEYIKENGIYNLKSVRKSTEIGKEVEQYEKQHHKKLQKEYENVFRPYHTEQFFRIAGIDELLELLRGKTIISKNSMQRYGRKCVDITTNGYYHDIYYGETKVRIPFIRKDADGGWHERFTSKIIDYVPERYHYQVPSYDYKDVDLNNIKYWDGSDWKPIDIRSLIRKIHS